MKMKKLLALSALSLVALPAFAQELTGANIQHTTSGHKYVLAQRQLKTWGELSLDFVGGYRLSTGNPQYFGLGAYYKFVRAGSGYASIGVFAIGSEHGKPDFGFGFSAGFEF